MEHMTNKQIEDEAIKAVLAYEKNEGRTPRDIRKEQREFDVISSDRQIEVKGAGRTLREVGYTRLIQDSTVRALRMSNDCFIYIVDNVCEGADNAGIYILTQEQALSCLNDKPQKYFELRVGAKKAQQFRVKP
jgi:hypothetical protein